MSTDITTGQVVQYTNRKGTVMSGEVLEILPAEVHGEAYAVILFHDGPLKDGSMSLPVTKLSPVAA